MENFGVVCFANENDCVQALSPVGQIRAQLPPGSGRNQLPRWASIPCFLLILAVFAIPSQAQTYTALTTFTGGLGPEFAPLVQGFDGNFYGASELGGANNKGAIYKVTPDGVVTVVYSFCAQLRCTDGVGPGGLILGKDGNFYGSTDAGGTVDKNHGGDGTFFKITPAGVLTTLSNFCRASCGEGSFPSPVLQARNGSFYGTTIDGGTHNQGTVFKMTAQGAVNTVYSFCSVSNCGDGVSPGSLLQATDGSFYGTTSFAGPFRGTLFKLLPGGKLTTLHTFCVDVTTCLDGDVSAGALVQGIDGDLYGVNHGGGSLGGGTIYKISSAGELTILYSFCGKVNCPDGSLPSTGLVLASDGNFYGTTTIGGNRISGGCGAGCGVIYQITPQGALTTLYKFCPQPKCLNGPEQNTPLVQGTDGSLYGMSGEQGAKHPGTIYKLDVGIAPFVKTLPASGKAGVSVVILGNNLIGTTEVAFNGATASFKVVSSTEITAKVPPGATTGQVTVSTPAGTLSSNLAFRVP
jgi:uncharacterized repeat protein (TIGR03803 family)